MARRLKHTRSIARAEVLESRRLMCALHTASEPVEVGPIDPPMQNGVPVAASDPANIIWTNRGTANAVGAANDTDGFGARFGTSANLARAVVDAVIVAYERMIGTFNYASAGVTYSLNLSMSSSGSGFGASAGLSNTFGGKPSGGSITMGAGNGSANANDDNGWFLDPTPYDSSEFLGNIVNAFSGDAQGGSPASGKGDFFTVVAAEMTHCMGLFGSSLPLWAARTTNTGISDTVPGFLWVFQGPSIKHLMTSDNAGSQDFGSAVHSSEPNNTIVFGGDTYVGAEDQGNYQYTFSRRYMINNAFALMFKDAYSYGSIDPAKYGTMYSNLNETTGLVTVRGGAGTSADTITITNTGSKVTVSVDVGTDVPGTGALPGPGNLPAFVTEYDVSQISSISISAGDGDDIININSLDNATPMSIGGENGNDTINIASGVYENILSNVIVSGGPGTDTLVIDDTLDTGNDTYNYTGAAFSKTGSATTTLFTLEGVTLKANGFDNIINVTGVATGAPLTVQAGNGNDTFNVGSTNISGILALLTLDGGGQTDALNILDSGFGSATTYTLSATNFGRSTNSVSVNYATIESIAVNGSSGSSIYNVTNTALNVPVLITAGTATDNLNINETAVGGDVTVATSTGLDLVSVNADATGQAIVRFNGITALGSLSAGTGGLVSLQITGKQAISSKILSLTGTGRLDLNDDGLVLDYTCASPLASIEPAILSGYAAGAWNGAGIASSLAAASPSNRAVGYGEASPLGYAGNNYMGIVPDGTALLFRYTVLADASLDGTVGSTDFNAFIGGYGLSSSAPQPMWSQGNFDFNQKVNTIDFNWLAGQFGIVLPGPLLSSPGGVPSPAIFSNQPLNDDSEIDLLA